MPSSGSCPYLRRKPRRKSYGLSNHASSWTWHGDRLWPACEASTAALRVCNIPESMASIKLCDAPVGAGTCDAVICVEHALHVDPNTRLLPVACRAGLLTPVGRQDGLFSHLSP